MNLLEKIDYLKHIIKYSNCNTDHSKNALSRAESLIEKKRINAEKRLAKKKANYGRETV